MAQVSQTDGNAGPPVVDESGAKSSAVLDSHTPAVQQEPSCEEPPKQSKVREPDNSLESNTTDKHPEVNILGNNSQSSEEDLMQFAEVLYKCTLCTSLPCILTSKDSFLAHVTKEHLTKQTSVRDCGQCDLKFGTDEDLRAHVDSTHKDVTCDDSDNSSLSDSSAGSPKPVSDMEEKRTGPPVYVVGSPAMKPRLESPNPIKKDFPCNKYTVVKPSAPVVKTNDLPKTETLTKIQKLTDQIVQSQTPGTPANILQSWSSMSSFTPEFGRYTKLVREGGNIVYFCQVCNWKCQVKAAFHAHCSGPHHTSKVRQADQSNPNRKRSGPTSSPSPGPAGSPGHSRSPTGLLTFANESDLDEHRREVNTPNDQKQGVSTEQAQPRSSVSDMPFLQGLLFNQRHEDTRRDSNGFTFQRRTEKDRTPENENARLTAEAFLEMTKRTSNSPMEIRPNEMSMPVNDEQSVHRNKRKRPTPVALRNQTSSKNSWSDSDSDECAGKSGSSASESDQPSKKYKSEAPVQRDDFHSRLMKKVVSPASSHVTPVSTQQPDHSTPYLQNSFRNRLFASAFGASFGPMYGWYGQQNSLLPTHTEENGDSSLSDNPFKNSIHYGSKLFPSTFTGYDYSGKHRQISEALAARHKFQHDRKGDNSPKFDENGSELKTLIKQEPTDNGEQVFRCSMCEFTCEDINNYRHHFMAEHGIDGADSFLGESQFSSMNEGWKMTKIRDCLPDLLVESSKGNVSRDLLLQKASLHLGLPEVIHWGPACNKAVREVFQNSMAQRKGKYKNYFFGVALLEHAQEQDELSDSENITYQPLRDMSQDLERILEHLPELVYWSGEGETGVSRDELLELLADRMGEREVQHWGVQCNRAVRMLFPDVQMKRKGKYKTVFFGVDYSKNLQKSSFIPTKRGRPRKLNDDEEDDVTSSPPPSAFVDKHLLSWRAQIQQMKFFSQPRFQHHWGRTDALPLYPSFPPRDGSTEISKDYNFLASELRNSYLSYHMPFGFTSGFPATVQHKPEVENGVEDSKHDGIAVHNGYLPMSDKKDSCDEHVEK